MSRISSRSRGPSIQENFRAVRGRVLGNASNLAVPDYRKKEFASRRNLLGATDGKLNPSHREH